jgi:hypothetical protein
MKRPAPDRGQTLVLFALTLLLTSLLVLMTLSISTRVKEKMELQAVADAAAYSNAVVTARAYNEIALMSRAQIGKMVSMAAVQSLISWSSYYRAQVEATRRAYNMAKLPYIALLACCIPTSGCTQFCNCARQAIQDINLTRNQLAMYQNTLDAQWQSLDQGAATQTANLQSAAALIYGAQLERYFRLRDKLNNQEVVRDIVNKARSGSRWPGEWSAPSGADDVTMDEAVGIPLINGRGGAIIPVNATSNHHVYAAMGSRGFSFTTRRTRGGLVISAQLRRVLPPRDNVLVTNSGSAYFARDMNHGALFPRGPSGRASWADDHAQGIANTTTFGRGQPPCPTNSVGISNAMAFVRSNERQDTSDMHFWTPGMRPDMQPPERRHTLGRCISCPGIWPMFVDYNDLQLLSGDNNLWGQPKNYAVVQRDYTVRMVSAPPEDRDPWTRFFTFNFTNSGASTNSVFDNRGIRLSPQNGGLNISRQTALSAGIAYYHRHDHWREPPNLLNPYWRATLVPYDVDRDGRNDVGETLDDAGVDWAADAARALRTHGYTGGP